MGTNYYHITDVCPHCKRGDEKIHIGKSSFGWPFSVHIIPEEGIMCWDDWKNLLVGQVIRDEYGREITLKMLDELVVSKRIEKDNEHVIRCYKEYPNFCKPDPVTGDKLSKGEFS